mmetsp:Transcript_3495/g.7938  ORF Transcript_3495/g.7938 Transcript_3495/m.7938 type:complete len:451 (+) Transcript_3495:58-1410(+)
MGQLQDDSSTELAASEQLPSPILTFVDPNNGKIHDEFLQAKPDDIDSGSSSSEQEANQTELNQGLEGPLPSDQINKRPWQYISYRKRLLLGALLLITIISATLASAISQSGSGSIKLENETATAPTLKPSSITSDMPSLDPANTIISAASAPFESSSIPSDMPSDMPSLTPSSAPTMNPTGTYKDKVETIFYAIGDVPYNDLEKVQLRDRMINLPQDGEFLVHLGDIRSGKKRTEPCRLEQYQQVRDLLLQSKIPVFIIPGDNEWNECPNHQDGERFWKETFHDFDKRWNHTIQVYRHPMPELFYFVHKRTLFFGLNLVGGKMTDYEFYFNKFRYEFEVVKSMIDKYVVAGNAVNVVIFGHAFPKDIHHRSFFEPLRDYIDRKLKNKVPILYLNGDKHVSGSVGEYAKFIFMCTDCPMIRNCSSTSLRRTTWANQTSIDCKWTLVQFTHP